jgi:hypothetical protein
MRLWIVIFSACLVATAAGCGKGDESTPAACLEGPATYLRALEAAPAAVKLEGETPISECLIQNQSGGDIARVGESLVLTATRLNADATADPGGEANLQLGYLVGAVERGIEETEGIHADLLRRLEVAARYAPGRRPPSAAFLRTYREGFDAGRSGG